MKRTYTTIMPDKVGALMDATEIMAQLGLNITRVSYNKAVDAHVTFVEVEGSADQLDAATNRLAQKGYLQSDMGIGRVVLIEFKLRDEPGYVLRVLALISGYHFNISYISTEATGEEYQYVRMGLFVENSRDVSDFIHEVSLLCDIRVIDYNKTEKVLDNTVFYVSFANGIAEMLGLTDAQKRDLIVDANRIMQTMERREHPFHTTFEYLGKSAELLAKHSGAAYVPRVTHFDEIGLTLLEPPCGSNSAVIAREGRLLFVDSGFARNRAEAFEALRGAIPGFDGMEKDVVITHADVDHCGMLSTFENAYMSLKAYENFARERAGTDNFREENPFHAPYVRISKILSDYAPPDARNMRVIGGSSEPVNGLLERIGSFCWADLDFEVYEGAGGHVRGEIVLVERRLRIAFTGDIFVNIKGFLPVQAQYNRLAPYLMTSVDTDPARAARERQAVFEVLGQGRWTVFGGHGAAWQGNT